MPEKRMRDITAIIEGIKRRERCPADLQLHYPYAVVPIFGGGRYIYSHQPGYHAGIIASAAQHADLDEFIHRIIVEEGEGDHPLLLLRGDHHIRRDI